MKGGKGQISMSQLFPAFVFYYLKQWIAFETLCPDKLNLNVMCSTVVITSCNLMKIFVYSGNWLG